MTPAHVSSTGPMIKVLGAVSLICGVLIVGTHISTLGRIRHNREIIMRESVEQLLPGIQKQVIYGIQASGDLTILPGVESEGPRLGIVIETSDRGYADVISAMYAYSPEKQVITGFKVVEMRETPGLGDKISSDPGFLENFKNLEAKLLHAIAVVKHGTKKNPWEIDAISGATVSSRAVGRMLQKSVQSVVPVIAKNLDRIQRGI